MRKKEYLGKIFVPGSLPEGLLEYLPDTFELPVWRLTIPDDGYEAEERAFYYADVFVGADMRIAGIDRNKDIYLTNYIITRFPPALEKTFGELMSGAMTD